MRIIINIVVTTIAIAALLSLLIGKDREPQDVCDDDAEESV